MYHDSLIKQAIQKLLCNICFSDKHFFY